MSTADDAIQPAPPEAPPAPPAVGLPLPPATAAAAPAPVRLRRGLSRGLDVALVGAVLLFAFLASSFAVRNNDFWLHLATGRLVAQGRYHFGEDPFAYTTAGTYWANHAWLFDLAVYAVYQGLGGAALVVLKALVVTGLAGLMLAVRRPGAGPWLPAPCTALALLAMSPRLLFQPALVSCAFVGLTLWLLWRSHASVTRWGGLRYGLLLALFVVWVNVDAWFFLGPLLVALFWLGERLGGGPRTTPGWLVPAGLAVCLLNPHHLHAFDWPAALSPAVWTSGLPRDVRFQPLFLSPWQLSQYLQPSVGLSAAGLSYFVLTALGLVSFALGRSGLRDWRLPVWAAFFALGAWQLRLVPFFAVVAGPITAVNLQDWLARRRAAAAAGAPPLWGAAARAVLVLAVLALAVLSWPGWLQAMPHDRHRVAWEVQPDPSLRRVAEGLHQWHQQSPPAPGEHLFATHPDVAHYCAWFCPEEKGFLDHRFALFTPVAAPYEAVCRALGGEDEAAAGAWRQVLDEYGVTTLVLYDTDLQRLFAAVHRLAQDPGDEWALCRIDGRALVFRRRRAGGDTPARPRCDPARLAFAAGDDAEALPPAPREGPGRPPRPRDRWERFARPSPPPTWESDAATLSLRYFDEVAGPQRRESLARSLSAYAAGLVGLPALGPEPWAVSGRVVLPLLLPDPFLPDLDTRPPELPLLAVRAARRALAANPDDANAWLRLGQAYLALYRLTGERPREGTPGPGWQLLTVLRHVQAVTALEHALILDPQLESAHRALAELYAARAYLDAALEHRLEAMRLARARPDQEEKEVKALEQLVRDRKNEFAIHARPLTGDSLARARLAINLGLARVALDEVLLKSSVKLFGGEGARLELELLLMLGRAEQVRVLLDDDELRENKHLLGEAEVPAPPRPGYRPSYRLPSYEWLRFYQSAATGDYGAADAALREVLAHYERQEEKGPEQVRRALPLAVAAEVGLAAPGSPPWMRIVVANMREHMSHLLAGSAYLPLERADLSTLGGLLALEQGATAAADDYFRAAVVTGGAGNSVARPLAVSYLRRLREAREESGGKGDRGSR